MFSCGPTAAEDWCNGFGFSERKNGSSRKRMARMSENNNAVEELVFSQKRCTSCTCTTKLHREVHHFWHKNNIIVTLTFSYWIPVLIAYFGNHAGNFVKICNIYANQLVIKVAISILILTSCHIMICILASLFWDMGYFAIANNINLSASTMTEIIQLGTW